MYVRFVLGAHDEKERIISLFFYTCTDHRDVSQACETARQGRENSERRRGIICDNIFTYLRKIPIYGRVFLMDIEDKKKINEILLLTQENNVYVKKIRRTQKNSQVFRMIYLVILLGIMCSGFYFAQPYLKNVTDLYNGAMGTLKSVQGMQGSQVLK